jgi:hypothetical protein
MSSAAQSTARPVCVEETVTRVVTRYILQIKPFKSVETIRGHTSLRLSR